MLGSGSCDLNAASPHFLFLPHLPSSIYILYFLFCILYCVFLILLFRNSSGYFFASLDFSIRGQRKSKFVVLHILQLLLFYESHFVACCNVYYGRRRLLQFQCNRFCFKKRNVFYPAALSGVTEQCSLSVRIRLSPPSFSLSLPDVCLYFLSCILYFHIRRRSGNTFFFWQKG